MLERFSARATEEARPNKLVLACSRETDPGASQVDAPGGVRVVVGERDRERER